jgi:hypothetical protein
MNPSGAAGKVADPAVAVAALEKFKRFKKTTAMPVLVVGSDQSMGRSVSVDFEEWTLVLSCFSFKIRGDDHRLDRISY